MNFMPEIINPPYGGFRWRMPPTSPAPREKHHGTDSQHQRSQQGINDYFWMNHDGQGAGVKNFDNGGKVDNERTARVNGTKDETLDDFNVSAMWEAWF